MLKKNNLNIVVILVCFILVAIAIFIAQQNKSNQSDLSSKVSTEIFSDKKNDTELQKPNNLEKVTNKTGIAVDLNDVVSGLRFSEYDKISFKPETTTEILKSSDPLCQPDDFDPTTTKYTKNFDENVTPSEFYEIDNPSDLLKSNIFQIDGTDPKNPIKLTLPAPLSATQFNFSCASQTDTVLQIKSDKDQVVLIKGIIGEINQNMFSKDGKFAYLNYLTLKDDKYIQKYQILDILNLKLIDLSNLTCVSDGFWGDKYLITYQNPDSEYKRGSGLDMCTFDNKGLLINSFSYPLNYIAGAGYYLDSVIISKNDKIGIYNHQTFDFSQGSCILSVFDTTNKISKEAILSQSDQSGNCPKIEIQELDTKRAVFNF